MKLYLMKQSAIDYLKANMQKYYNNYYRFDTSGWIEDLFDYDPFEFYMDIPEFELASLRLNPGEIDLENCKILYSNLSFLSNSMASEERLWAGLCNKTFYTYLRARLQLAKKHLRKAVDDAESITSRYFYRNSGRSGMFRNVLARCWWTGKLTYYTADKGNPWVLLDAVGPEDLISKISDIFYSNTYASNSSIVAGFCMGLQHFRDHGIPLSNRDHIRPTAQFLNAVGGSELLDMFSSDEIRNMVITHIYELIDKKDTGLMVDDGQEDSLNDMEDVADENAQDAEEVNVDYDEYLGTLQPNTTLDLDSVLGEPESAERGCVVHVHILESDKYYDISIPLEGEQMNTLQEEFLNQPKGYSVFLKGKTYVVDSIHRGK